MKFLSILTTSIFFFILSAHAMAQIASNDENLLGITSSLSRTTPAGTGNILTYGTRMGLSWL